MKIFEAIVVSLKMQNTAVVQVTREKIHPLYKKRIKRMKRYKVESGNFSLSVNDHVRIQETRPLSKNKHFKILEVVRSKKETKNDTA